MRSVVVVLPASMWATIPMLRIFSSDPWAVMVAPCFVSSCCVVMNPPRRLPPIVRERLVRFGHLVRILAPLHRGAGVVAGVKNLRGQLVAHRPPRPLSGVLHEPADSEGHPAFGPHLDRHLIGCAADPARLDLEHRHDVVERLVEHLDRLLAALLLDRLQRRVHDALCEALLAPRHHLVDEPGHGLAPERHVWRHAPTRNRSFARHQYASTSLRIVCTPLGPLPLRTPAVPRASGGAGGRLTPPLPSSAASRRTWSARACGPGRLRCRGSLARCGTGSPADPSRGRRGSRPPSVLEDCGRSPGCTR